MPGGGPKITIDNLQRPATFSNAQAWNDDLQKMAALLPVVAVKNVLNTRRQAAALSNDAGAAPLVAAYAMEPDTANQNALIDLGPLKMNGQLEDGARYYGGGHADNALQLTGGKSRAVVPHQAAFDALSDALTVAAWVRLDELPRADTVAFVVSTRSGWQAEKPWSMRLAADGNWGFEGHDAGGWKQEWSEARLASGAWHHLAFSFQAGGDLVFYLDGKEARRVKAPGQLSKNNEPLVFGYEEGGDFSGGGRSGLKGLIDEAPFMPPPTPDQVEADMAGTLPVRAPQWPEAGCPAPVRTSAQS